MKRIAVLAIAVLAFSAGIHTGRWVEAKKNPPVVNVTVNPVSTVSTVDPIYNCTIKTHDDSRYISNEEFTLTATQIINMERGDIVGHNHVVTVPLWNTDKNEMMGLISTENSSFNCVLEKK